MHYYGGAFAFPIMIISSATLEFWEIFLGETHFPFKIVKMGFLEAWLLNMRIGFVEELMFRGVIWILALAHQPVLIPAVISSILFGLAHYEYGTAKILSAFTMGMVFCAITVQYGLIVSMIAHAFLDLFLTLQAIYLE